MPRMRSIKPEFCYCQASRRGARLMSRIYDRHLAPAGISISQFSILSRIARQPGVLIADLADGILEGDVIECSLHFGAFHVPTGKAVQEPCSVDLKTFRTEVKDGRVLVAECFLPPAEDRRITLDGDGANVESLECWTLKSSWRGLDE